MTEPTEAGTGDADRFSFSIERITVGDGGAPHPLGGVGSVTVVVGANNVGKSTVLAQIREMLMQSNMLTRTTGPRVVTQLIPLWTGSEEDAEAWIRAHAAIHNSGGYDQAHRPGLQPEAIGQFRSAIRADIPGRLINWFVEYQTVGSRIGMPAAGRLAMAGDPPSHPLQIFTWSAPNSLKSRK